jgi:hypothetical protein
MPDDLVRHELPDQIDVALQKGVVAALDGQRVRVLVHEWQLRTGWEQTTSFPEVASSHDLASQPSGVLALFP